MKNIKWIICCILLSPIFIQAQQNYFMSGTVNFEHSRTFLRNNDISDFDTFASIKFAKILKEQWIAGLNLTLGQTTHKMNFNNSPNISSYRINRFGLGGFIRYRFSIQKAYNFYMETSGNYILSNNQSFLDGDDFGAPTKSYSYNLNLGPGIEVKMLERWFLSATLGSLSYEKNISKSVDYENDQFFIFLRARNLKFALNFLF